MANRFAIETVFKGKDDLTAPLRKMQSKLKRFTTAGVRNFKQLNRAAKRVTSTLWKMGRTALKAGVAFAGIATAATIATINKLAAGADALAKESRRLMFPIKELQQWKFVGEQAGVSQELLSKSLGAFTKRMGEARGGIGPLISGLKNTHPELVKQLKTTDDVSEAFELVVDAMRNATTATERAALANAAFSRSGLKLANIADLSKDQITLLKKEMEENGLITKRQAEQAEAYNDSLNSLKRSFMGLLQNALLPLLPKMTELVKRLRAFIVANKEVFKQKIGQLFERIKNAVLKLAEGFTALNKKHDLMAKFSDVVGKLGSGIAFLVEHGRAIATFTAALAATSIVINAVGVAAAIASVGLSPWLLLIGAVAGAATILVANWGPITEWWSGIWDTIGGTVFAMVENITSAIDELFAKFDRLAQLNREFGPGKLGASLSEGAFNVVQGAKGLFMSDEEKQAITPGVVTPSERVSKSVSESIQKQSAEVTIKDDTGRAEVTGGTLSNTIKLQPSGAF